MHTKVNDRDLSHISEEFRDKFQAMLRRYDSLWSGHLEHIDVSEHHIHHVSNTEFARQRPYHAGSFAGSHISGEIQRLL